MTAVAGEEIVAPKSVRDLVRPQLGLDEDPWELALVQRDLVWKQDRMIALLDSLLAGYPIGSLLLCRVQQETDARQFGTSQGQERRVAAGTPQLVDGQQRAYALLSIFTGEGHGTFHLSLTKEWDHRRLNYIEWRPRVGETDGGDESPDDEVAIPSDYVDLSKWAGVADEVCATLSDVALEEIVAKVTPGFVLPQEAGARATVLRRLESLCLAWQSKRIPVITATVDGPEDLLEVFTRVNRGGAQVSGNDLYFAAVKTFWHDPTVNEHASITAKEALAAIESASGGFLDTWGALSLVSRLALVGLSEGDMVPLKVDRLSRANKTYVIRALRAISPEVAERIEPFTHELRAHSELRQGLRFVHRHLWEEVFAWVVASNRGAEGWAVDDLSAVETYLLGASLFAYPSILGDPYRRDALAVALAAGLEHETFPVSRLLAVARNRGEDLRRGRSVVLPSTAVAEVAKRNSALVVAVAQGLDDDIANLDWDHILASDFKEKFRLKRGAGRRFREEAAHFQNPGNLWQIDFSANRSLKATPPAEKFRKLESWPEEGMGRIGPSRNPGISSDHLQQFETIGRLLGEGRVDEAAPLFATLIQSRNEWLASRLLEWPSSPPIAAFAPDTVVPPQDVPLIPASLSQVLGVERIKVELVESRAKLRADAAGARIDNEMLLGLSASWARQTERVISILREVTKRHAKISGDGLYWRFQRNPERQSLGRLVPLLPLESKDRFKLIVTGIGTGEGRSPFLLRVQGDSPGFATLRERLREAGELEWADADGGIEIAVPVGPDLDWGKMFDAVDRTVTRFREIAEADDAAGDPTQPPVG
jgi:hypothetical protein